MTRWTNRYGVDEAIARAVMGMDEDYKRVGDISVTTLIRPPQMVALEHQHRDEIEEDVSDGLWRLLGKAVHQVLGAARLENALQEERLTYEVGGWVVSGQPDLWVEPYTLKDYKITSVWSFLLGDKPDWEAQLNFYAILYERNGFAVEQAWIAAILRDWSFGRYQEGGNYPPSPFMSVNVPLWPSPIAEQQLRNTVALHKQAREEGSFPPCTDEDRWAKPDVWAVKKRGNKRAMSGGVHTDAASAEAFASRQTVPVEIEHRPGGNTRCESYCRAAPWCRQWAGLQPAGALAKAEAGS